MSWPACPKCGGATSCIDSRPSREVVRRRYRCLKKNHRWTTIEQLAVREPRDSRIVTAHGKTLTIREWADKLGLHPSVLISRLDIQCLHPDQAMRKGRVKSRRYLKVAGSY